MFNIVKIMADWKDVKNVSRTTVNKQHSEIEATKSFKKKILISEHSPIREMTFRWQWLSVKSWIATHFSRHRFESYISTQRSDRINMNRDESPQGTLVNMDCSANAQMVIDVSRKRLCLCSHAETVAHWEELKVGIAQSGEKEISDVMVPNCIYRCGCPEFQSCGFDKILKDVEDITDIQSRYDHYNKVFWKNR